MKKCKEILRSATALVLAFSLTISASVTSRQVFAAEENTAPQETVEETVDASENEAAVQEEAPASDVPVEEVPVEETGDALEVADSEKDPAEIVAYVLTISESQYRMQTDYDIDAIIAGVVKYLLAFSDAEYNAFVGNLNETQRSVMKCVMDEIRDPASPRYAVFRSKFNDAEAVKLQKLLDDFSVVEETTEETTEETSEEATEESEESDIEESEEETTETTATEETVEEDAAPEEETVPSEDETDASETVTEETLIMEETTEAAEEVTVTPEEEVSEFVFDAASKDEIIEYVDSLAESMTGYFEFFDSLTDEQYLRYWVIDCFDIDYKTAANEDLVAFVEKLYDDDMANGTDDYEYFMSNVSTEDYAKIITLMGDTFKSETPNEADISKEEVIPVELPNNDRIAVILPENAEENDGEVTLDDDITVEIAPAAPKEETSTNIEDYETYDSYASAVIGVDALRTGETLDFYNTFVDNGVIDENTTIDNLMTGRTEEELLAMNPIQQIEQVPVFHGADGKYYAITSIPSLNGTEAVDFQPATDDYTGPLAFAFNTITYIGNGVYEIPEDIINFCYTEIESDPDEDGNVTIVKIGLRIQALYGYDVSASANYRSAVTYITYPDGTTVPTLSVINVMDGVASVQLFDESKNVEFTSDKYEVSVSVNKGQFYPEGSSYENDCNTLTFSVGDSRAVSRIDIEIKTLETVEISLAEFEMAMYLAAPAMVYDSPVMLADAAPTSIKLKDIVEYNGRHYMGLNASDLPANFAVGDKFIYSNVFVDRASIYTVGGVDGQLHVGAAEIPTAIAQGFSQYRAYDKDAEALSYFKNGYLNAGTDPYTFNGMSIVEANLANITKRAENAGISGILGNNPLFGYISQALGSTTTNNKTLNLEQTQLIFSCMHAWSSAGEYAGVNLNDPAIKQAVNGFTNWTNGDWSLVNGTGFTTNIGLQCVSKTTVNGVTYATFVVVTSMLPIGTGPLPGNYQCGFSTLNVAYNSTGYLRAEKKSSNTNITNGNSNYSTNGIVYRVYTNSACTTRATDVSGNYVTLTVGGSNLTNTVEMMPGTYYVKEFSVPANCNYKLSTTVYPVTVTSGTTPSSPNTAAVTDEPYYYSLKVQKQSTDGTMVNNNKCYSYEGIQFKVYTTSACTTEAKNINGQTFTLTTDKNGYTGTVNLARGTYYVREVESSLAGKGWKYNSTPVKVDIPATGTTGDPTKLDPTVCIVKNKPLDDPLAIQLEKVDKNGNIVDGWDMSGAQYTVKFYNGQYTINNLPATPTYTWVTETKKYTNAYRAFLNDDCVISGEAIYGKSALGTYKLPLGTVTIEETKAPNGFTAKNSNIELVDDVAHSVSNSGVVLFNIVDQNSTTTVKYGNLSESAENGINLIQYENYDEIPVVIDKADILNIDPYGNASFDGIRFAIINDGDNKCITPSGAYADPGEIVEIITFADGEAKSSGLAYGKYKIIELQTDDTAVVGEKPTKGNSELANGHYQISSEEYKFVIDSTVTDKQTVDTNGNEIQFHDLLYLGTTARDAVNGTHTADGDYEVNLIDTVEYRDLDDTLTYHLEAKLVNRADGSAALDKDGNEITASLDFVPEAGGEGTVDVTFAPFETEIGMDTVVFEYLYLDAKLITKHERLTTESQRFNVTKIRTMASAGDTADHVTMGDDNISITDEIMVEGLIVGEHYWIDAVLVDAYTGDVIVDDDGNEVTASDEFTATSAETVRSVTFTFKGTGLTGTKTVATEYMYTGRTADEKGDLVGSHTALDDADETTYIPEIRTTLVDSVTEIDHAMDNTEVTLQDTVMYRELLPGKEYTVSGFLVNKLDGTVITDENGDAVTGETTFTCEESEGSVVVEFTFNSGILKNEPVVAFESLTIDGVEVAVHMDIFDEEQDTFVPSIKTTALGEDTQDHITNPDEEIVIVDSVDYTGLKPNTEYRLEGILMDKETGEEILDDNGEVVTGETAFVTPEAEDGAVAVDGTVEVVFKFSGVSLEGKTTVVYEDLFTSEKQVAVHHDIDSEDQSVDFPKVRTTAKDTATGNHTAHLDKKVTIEDEVRYNNLSTDGRSYTVKGTIMVKETGEPLKDAKGNVITAEKEFVPTEKDGKITLSFEVDTTLLEGSTLVVFEDIQYNGVTVCMHASLDDEEQSIHVPSVKTTAVDKESDSHEMTVTTKAELKIVDTVAFTGLTKGESYTVTGEIYDKTTGKSIGVTGETTFTAESEEGTVEVEFQLELSDLKEETDLVVFEKLYDAKGNLIGRHEDIEDKEQTVKVTIPVGNVNAGGPKFTFKTYSPNQVLGIEVSYTGLIIAGILMAAACALLTFLLSERRRRRR